MTHPALSRRYQTIVGAGVCLVALGLAGGAVSIPADAGYSGVGPNILPWLVSAALLLCGAFLVYEARSGGFRDMDEGEEVVAGGKPYWPGFVWMSAGLLLNAALITTLGFILSCTLYLIHLILRYRTSTPRQKIYYFRFPNYLFRKPHYY